MWYKIRFVKLKKIKVTRVLSHRGSLGPLRSRDKVYTHLHERRDDRAVEEALQEQQVCVVGDFTQLLDIVTYVHEGGWNSNGALVHNQLRIHGPGAVHRRMRHTAATVATIEREKEKGR